MMEIISEMIAADLKFYSDFQMFNMRLVLLTLIEMLDLHYTGEEASALCINDISARYAGLVSPGNAAFCYMSRSVIVTATAKNSVTACALRCVAVVSVIMSHSYGDLTVGAIACELRS
jgi:hypothetical protein